MPHYHLALLGFGNVGQALARLLLAKEKELERRATVSPSPSPAFPPAVMGLRSTRLGST